MIHKCLGGAGAIRDAQALFDLLMYFVQPKPGAMSCSSGQEERVLVAPMTVLIVQGGIPVVDAAAWARSLSVAFKIQCRFARQQRRLPKRLFEHVVFGFHPADDVVLGDSQRERGLRALSLVVGLLAASSLRECPSVFVVHGDRDSLHVHCAIMGCDISGRIWSSRSPAIFAELERLCRETEAAHGLHVVARDGLVRGLSPGERRYEQLTGTPAPRSVLQARLSSVLAARPSPAEFGRQCLAAGVLVVPKRGAGRVAGISYRLLDGDEQYGLAMQRHFSGSDLGKMFVWSNIAVALGYDDAKHRVIIDQWDLEADFRLRKYRCVLRPAPGVGPDTPPTGSPKKSKKVPVIDAAILEKEEQIIVLEARPRSVRRALELALQRGWSTLADMPLRHLFEPIAAKLGIAIAPPAQLAVAEGQSVRDSVDVPHALPRAPTTYAPEFVPPDGEQPEQIPGRRRPR